MRTRVSALHYIVLLNLEVAKDERYDEDMYIAMTRDGFGYEMCVREGCEDAVRKQQLLRAITSQAAAAVAREFEYDPSLDNE